MLNTTEQVPLFLLSTRQNEVYRDRVDFYKKRYKDGLHVDPIELIERENDYEIGNGNHRALARHELGEPIIDAKTGYSGEPAGRLKSIEDLTVLPGDRPGDTLPTTPDKVSHEGYFS